MTSGPTLLILAPRFERIYSWLSHGFIPVKIYNNNNTFLSLNHRFDWGGSDESICLKAFYKLETWSQIIPGDFVCC